MKKIILLALLLCACEAGAQKIILDRTYVVKSGQNFTQVKERVFDNGKRRLDEIPYDTAQVLSLYISLQKHQAEEVASAALNAIGRSKAVKQIRDYDDGSTAVTGISTADSVARTLYSVHIQGRNMELDSAGVVHSVQINPRAAGGYNLRLNGKNYRIDLFEKRWIRLRNFPAQGTDTDLWLYKGEYISFDGAYILRDASGSNIRTVQPAPAIVPPPKKTAKKKKRN